MVTGGKNHILTEACKLRQKNVGKSCVTYKVETGVHIFFFKCYYVYDDFFLLIFL